MKRFSLALDNHSCLTLSMDVTCLSSDISVMPIPVKTIPVLFSRAFWVLPETGIAELVDRDNPGWGQWRTICPLNFGLATARRCALDRSAWRLLVEMDTSTWHAPERKRGGVDLETNTAGTEFGENLFGDHRTIHLMKLMASTKKSTVWCFLCYVTVCQFLTKFVDGNEFIVRATLIKTVNTEVSCVSFIRD